MNTSVSLLRICQQRFNGRWILKGNLTALNTSAALTQLIYQLIRSRAVTVVRENNIRPFQGQQSGNRRTDTAATSGDDSDPLVKSLTRHVLPHASVLLLLLSTIDLLVLAP
jgi:hypothetical protein